MTKLVKVDKSGKKLDGEPAQLKARELAKRAAEGDPDALKALEKIVVCFERWKKTLADQKEANRKAGEIEGAADATFENAVEQGMPDPPSDKAILAKLQAVETAWQEQKDAATEAGTLRNEAKDKVKAAAGKLERAAQDGAQMTLPGTEE